VASQVMLVHCVPVKAMLFNGNLGQSGIMEQALLHVVLEVLVSLFSGVQASVPLVHDFPKLHRWFAKNVLVPKWENGLNKLCLILSCFFGNSEHNILQKKSP